MGVSQFLIIFRPWTVDLLTNACRNHPLLPLPNFMRSLSKTSVNEKSFKSWKPFLSSSTIQHCSFDFETSFTSWKRRKRNLTAFVSKQSSQARAWEIITIKNNLHVDSARGVFGRLTNSHKAPLSARLNFSQTVAPKLRLAEIASASLVIPHARE